VLAQLPLLAHRGHVIARLANGAQRAAIYGFWETNARISRGSAALNGVMHQPEGGPQAVFRYRRAPRYPTGDNPAPGHLEGRAACYHFATQFDGTGQNGAVWPCAYGRNLGPETLTK
jgi:hypothetical protein